jgi:hypothetical protein
VQICLISLLCTSYRFSSTLSLHFIYRLGRERERLPEEHRRLLEEQMARNTAMEGTYAQCGSLICEHSVMGHGRHGRLRSHRPHSHVNITCRRRQKLAPILSFSLRCPTPLSFRIPHRSREVSPRRRDSPLLCA